MCLTSTGSGGFGYYLRNDPPGKNDLIVHDYFALVHGNYNADGDGEMHYEHDMDLAATWKQLATEYVECTEQRSTQTLKKVQEQARNDEVVLKGVLTRNQALTRTINRPGLVSKRQRMNRVDMTVCLQSEDLKRKQEAEKWLQVCVACFLFLAICSFSYRHLSSLCIFIFLGIGRSLKEKHRCEAYGEP